MYNMDQIKNMQEEFLKLQKIELLIDSDQSALSKLIAKTAGLFSTYDNPKKIEKLIKEAEEILKNIMSTGAVRGKMMSLQTMKNYLDKDEKAQKTQKALDLISRQNSARSKKRLSLYVDEMLRDANIMKMDIELFRKQGRLAGLSEVEINKQLASAAGSNASPVNAFDKRLKTLQKSVLRREASATEIDEYKKVTKNGEKWQWITVSGGPCPDCKIRAGVVLTLEQWQAKGLPGAGRTICRSSCMCKLIPTTIADNLFPEVKSFKWDKKDGVLTTFGEMRTFGAKKNKG